MAAELDIVIAGEPMRLYADRALYWPARQRLLIADLHLGKGDIFRRAGIAVPEGGTAHDLARIDRLLDHSGAKELWILGDVLHGIAHASTWRETFEQWRRRYSALRLVAITGNHDRDLSRAALDIELLGDTVLDPPFAMRHHPEPHPYLHVLCGHIHPLLALPGMRRRWPAFWLREGLTVLPAFSAFTGGAWPMPAPQGTRIGCVDGALIAVRARA